MPKEPAKLADEEIQAHLKTLPLWEIDNGMLSVVSLFQASLPLCSLPVLSLTWRKLASIILT